MDIPGYEIVETLGAGGFGTVYRARQLAVQREVALKIDSRALTSDRDRRRFMREVTAAGRLSGHPNVVAVYDAGVQPDGRPYMVLELCPGGSLNDRLQERGPFPPAEVRRPRRSGWRSRDRRATSTRSRPRCTRCCRGARRTSRPTGSSASRR